MSTRNNEVVSVGILAFDDVEVLDFCGPFEVFALTGDLNKGTFKVTTFAQKSMVTARNGLKLVPDVIIGEGEPPKLDILVVPGGLGTIKAVKDEELIQWVKTVGSKVQYLMSVCTGVSILGKSGFVDGMVVTTHHKAYDRVAPDCPNVKFCKCRRFIDHGKVLTSAGISAGIDLSLYMVKKVYGLDMAKNTADHMEYKWENAPCDTCTCQFD